ncbi:MAG TPA: hypothetical protein VK661_01930 [Planctomycetota bacterium]|nr:hypothetical protein [Planctomycetota bacterium]
MTRILALSAMAAACAALFSGCIVVAEPRGPRTVIVDDDGPEPVGTIDVVECRHHEGCGHYWYNGSWYLVRGHRHGPGCGHFFLNGRWVLAAPVQVVHGHVCTAACNHYFVDGRWYVMRKHHHGPGCGHILRNGIWVGVGF